MYAEWLFEVKKMNEITKNKNLVCRVHILFIIIELFKNMFLVFIKVCKKADSHVSFHFKELKKYDHRLDQLASSLILPQKFNN